MVARHPRLQRSVAQATQLDFALQTFAPADSPFGRLTAALGVDPTKAGWPDRFGTALRRQLTGRGNAAATLSLFAGAGGLDIGFHDAGFRILDAVEIDSCATASLGRNAGAEAHLGECAIRCMDIRDFHPPADRQYEFVVGGPPCQSFSAAGRRASGVAGLNDTRGTLFEEYVRILRITRPRGFLFENVYGITGANGGRAWERIVAAFQEAGYRLFHRILDAADYGVPQHRERLIVVGLREGEFRFPRPTHGPDASTSRPYYSAGQAVDGTRPPPVRDRCVRGRYGSLLEAIPPGLNYSFYTEELGHPRPVFAWRSKFSDFLYKADPARPVRTIKAQGGQYTGPFHWANRPFSVEELKRLQTFPDDYTLEGGRGAQIRQIGNSVPPQLARILGLAVRQQVLGDKSLPSLDLLDPSEPLGFRSRKRLLTDVYRRKAAEATDTGQVRQRRAKASRTVRRALGQDFSWRPVRGRSDGFEVLFTPSAEYWTIQLRRDGAAEHGPHFQVTVRPHGEWPLAVPAVHLLGPADEPLAFTAAWKALEEELRRRAIKEDLVQLCGYYQYEPRIGLQMKVSERPAGALWGLLRLVCGGAGVRRTASAKALSRVWGVPETEVPERAQALKTLGYEVRNPTTNHEIPAGHYLIPYAFPTLTPKSVQRHKALA